MGSLRWRLILAIVLITLAASTIVGIGLRNYTQREFRQFLEVETEVDAAELPDPSDVARHLDLGNLDQAAQSLFELAEASGDRLLLFTPQGTLIADSAPTDGTATYIDDELEIVRARTVDGEERSESFRIRGGLPLPSGENPQAVLFVLPAITTEHDVAPEEGFSRRVSSAHLLGVGVATLLALGIALLLARRIVGPVETLTGAALQLADGDLTQRVRVESTDEIGKLSESFNAMAATLERQEKTRRNMVSDIAHELRTPLTHLRCKLESVQDGFVSADAALIGDLHGEIIHLGRLVDDLQELALAEAGQLPMFPSPVKIDNVLRSVVAGLAGVSLEVSSDLPEVEIDPDRLRQVVRNLVENALRHGGDKVAVTAIQENDQITVSVRDNGPGVPVEHRPHVFERFHRTDPSRDRATGGAGLGLAITQQLVLAWGGKITLSSPPEGGAIFSFTVPQ